jgi:hypothetical protein
MTRAVLPLFLFSLCSAFAFGCGRGSGAGSQVDLDSTGVDECDDYLARVVACASKLPAQARPAHEAAIRTARDTIEARADADDAALEGTAKADARVALKTACKQMASSLAERAVCN